MGDHNIDPVLGVCTNSRRCLFDHERAIGDLWLDTETVDPRIMGLCKPPVAAGRGTGDRSFDVVPGHPEASIIPYRMTSTDPGEMMPEVGRALVHREGVDLISRYIAAMKGVCAIDAGPGA